MRKVCRDNTIIMKIALLIDGDNAQASLIEEIIAEVSKYGKATIRRIYGDWTSPGMKSWKPILNENAINAMQNFAYTTGKNATDGSMIIDAMDILHSKSVDGFCIVSSDSDFTGLAKRIREEGLFVMGIGRQTTPVSFVNSCEVFTQTENLDPTKNPSETENPAPVTRTAGTENGGVKKTARKKVKVTTAKPPAGRKIPDAAIQKINKAFDLAANEENGTSISKVGNILRQIDPSFDPRSFGFKKLTQLFESIAIYEVVENNINGLNHPWVKLK